MMSIHSHAAGLWVLPAPANDVPRQTRVHLRSAFAVHREIRLYQKTTNLLMPRAPFQRVIKEMMQNHALPGAEGFRLRRDALEALQEAAEAFVVRGAWACRSHVVPWRAPSEWAECHACDCMHAGGCVLGARGGGGGGS